MKLRFSILLPLLMLPALLPVRAQGLDYNILWDLQQHRTEPMNAAMGGLSNTLVLAPAVPAGLLVGGWLSDDQALLRSGCAVGGSFLIAAALTEGLKFSIRRPRPYNAYPLTLTPVRTTFGYSFPSGHTSLTFAVATSLSICYPKWYIIAPSMLWASGVAFSRLYLGVHYPSDVLTGALVGAGSAVIGCLVVRKMFPEEDPESTPKFYLPPLTLSF